MRANGFTESRWETASIAEVLRALPARELRTAPAEAAVGAVVRQMKAAGISQLPVVDGGKLVGILTESDVLARIVEGRATLESRVAEVMVRKVHTVHAEDDAGSLPSVFASGYAAVVVDDAGAVIGILTHMDLVDFLTRGRE
jgi:cystathionine beta-synthase